MLTLPGFSVPRASAVVRRFPTLRALMDQYARADLSEAAKRALLTDCYPGKAEGNGPRKMGKLSADVFEWLTTRDPDVLLGQGDG